MCVCVCKKGEWKGVEVAGMCGCDGVVVVALLLKTDSRGC